MKKLAINGGVPVRNTMKKSWPSWPVVGDEERKNLLETFESGKWWYGERVKEFEKKFAAFQNAKYGVTCTNGTAALEMALLACGIGDGDEVIVPPYSFVATASAVLKVNAIPIFADIELDSCNLDPIDAEAKISKKTKAIVPVHCAGFPVDMDRFLSLAEQYRLHIIEDACHSWGSQWNGKGTGALGTCGVFSFQVSKNITAGEGGILLSDYEEIADTARSYSNCGRGKDTPWYEHYLLGSNLRMTELQAAILLGQLTRLEEQTLKREENATYLNQQLQNIPGISLMKNDARVTRRGYHMYIFRFVREMWEGIDRNRFIEALNAEGIPSSIGYPNPLYKNPLFQKPGRSGIDYREVHCAKTEQICEEACWIPHTALLAEKSDMDDIVAALTKVWAERKTFVNS